MSLVVVTGASGHVGAALVRALLARGERVRALVRTDVRAVEGLDVEVRRVDVRERAAVEGALEGARVVYHAAAQLTLAAGPDPAAEAVNVEGTRNVVDACRAAGVRRLVHFSSAHALSHGGELLGAAEGRVYERSKADAERTVQAAAAAGDVDATIVSPAAVYGPFDHKPSYIGRVLLLLARGLVPATVGGGQSWVDVRDVAAAALAAAERGRTGARYVVGGHWHPMTHFATAAARASGGRAPLLTLPKRLVAAVAPVAERAARLARVEPLLTEASLDALEDRPRASDGLAERELGHAPRPLEETLADTYRWFEEKGMLRRKR